jgi:outer membrane immunogenic protein
MKWGAVIGGIALAALAAVPARAADMTVSPRAIPATSGYIPAQFFWTGFYLGAGIGDGWGTAPFIDPFNPAGTAASPSIKGFLVSGVMGINYQISSVVIGVESDFTGTWIKGSATDAPPAPNLPNTLTTQVFWTGSIVGRVGWAFDRVLVYGRGGVGFDYDRNTVGQASSLGSAVGSAYRTGWTVGGGVEYAITEHWTGRLEYDYFKFPSKAISFQGNTNPIFGGAPVGLNLSEIKVVMAYKF